MATSRNHDSVGAKITARESGQAAVEFAIVATLMLLLLCLVVDFGRALTYMQVMDDLTRQGSNLASRGDSLAQAAAAVIAGDSPLNLSANGQVIVTSVIDNSGTYTITGQVSQGSVPCTSKIGTVVGGKATVPSVADNMFESGQTVYITEVCYSYQPITPIGKLITIVMPSTLYEAAYF